MFSPERLAEIRTHLGLSQEKMARLIGVSYATVNRWELGKLYKSGPKGLHLELYRAIDRSMQKGKSAIQILSYRDRETTDPGRIIYHIFHTAYHPGK